MDWFTNFLNFAERKPDMALMILFILSITIGVTICSVVKSICSAAAARRRSEPKPQSKTGKDS